MATNPSPTGRDHALDFLRGACILSMALAHYGTPLSKWLNFRVLGFVTGAQGFLLISGLVSGIVYGRVFQRDGFQATSTKVWSRLRKLVLHIWLILTVAAVLAASLGQSAALQGSEWMPLIQHPGIAWLGGLLLIYQPPILDILAMYVVFLAVLPYALRALHNGRWRSYLLVVGTVYALGQVFSLSRLWPESMMILGGWSLPGWQLLFFAGVFLGAPFERPDLRFLRSTPAVVLSLAMASALFMLAHPRWIPGITTEGILALQDLDSTWAEKMANAPLSALNFLLIAHLISVAVPALNRVLPARNPLSLLGSKSLEVFSLHLLLLLAIWPLRPHLPAWAETPLLGVFLVLLWLPVLVQWQRPAVRG